MTNQTVPPIELPHTLSITIDELVQRLGRQITVWRRVGDSYEQAVGKVVPNEAVAAEARVVPSVGGSGAISANDEHFLPLGIHQGEEWFVLINQPIDLQAAANLVQASIELSQSKGDINRLEEENHSYAVQLATDLEELSALRGLVDSLAKIESYDDSLVAMAHATLPSMNDVIQAECLAYITPSGSKSSLGVQVMYQHGKKSFDESLYGHIISFFREKAQHGALVRNWAVGAKRTNGSGSDAAEEILSAARSLVLVPIKIEGHTKGWIVAINRNAQQHMFESSWQLSSDEFGSGEGTLLETAAAVMSMHATSLEMLREKEHLLVGMVRTLVSAIEAKDPYTCGHSERVALFAVRLAEEIGYSKEEVDNIYLSALLHDVGKIGVSDAVLNKHGKLTDEEFAEIARHPDEGWTILADLKQLKNVLPGVLHHHERWDGRGYPDKLSGVEIPLDARILAVVDAFDAMTSDRPYRNGMPNEKAQGILRDGAGSQWDPECVNAFFSCLEEIHEIQSSYNSRMKRERVPVIG